MIGACPQLGRAGLARVEDLPDGSRSVRRAKYRREPPHTATWDDAISPEGPNQANCSPGNLVKKSDKEKMSLLLRNVTAATVS
jgi:hypothetical protein